MPAFGSGPTRAIRPTGWPSGPTRGRSKRTTSSPTSGSPPAADPAEDEPAHYDFMSKLTPEDVRFRFFGTVRQLPHSEMARLTQINYDREMAFVATAPRSRTVRVARRSASCGPSPIRTTSGRVRDRGPHRRSGDRARLQTARQMIDYCRTRGTKIMCSGRSWKRHPHADPGCGQGILEEAARRRPRLRADLAAQLTDSAYAKPRTGRPQAAPFSFGIRPAFVK